MSADTPVSNGSLTLALVPSTGVTILSTGGTAPTSYTFNFDGNGNLNAAQVWGAGELTPSGSTYTANIWSAANGGGTLVEGPMVWIIGPSSPYAGTLYPNVTALPTFSFGTNVLDGVTVSGTASNGKVLTATSGSTADWQTPGSGSGTVTSVALSLPGIFTVSGSPVTTSGTLTGTLATESANEVFAGPTSGSAAAPTFRSLVNADIPTTLDLGNGTLAAPTYSFSAETGSGLWREGTAQPALSVTDTDVQSWVTTGTKVGSGMVIGWSSASGATGGSADTGLSRTAADSLALGDGTAGDASGNLSLSRVYLPTTNTVVYPTAVTGVTVQTNVCGVTIVAGELNTAGRWLHVSVRGAFSTTTTGTSLALKLVLDSTTLISQSYNPGSVTNVSFYMNADIITDATGTSGTLAVESDTHAEGIAIDSQYLTAPVGTFDLTASHTLHFAALPSNSGTSVQVATMGVSREN